MAAKTYEQIIEGEWITVPKRGHKNACCDCGLTHRFDYRMNKFGQPEIRVRIDRRATAAIRRSFNFERDD